MMTCDVSPVAMFIVIVVIVAVVDVVLVVITGFNRIPSWPQINQVVTCIGLLLHYFSWEANYCQ